METESTQFAISLASTIKVDIKHIGEQTIDLTRVTPAWIEWAIAMGVRQSCGDADAGKPAGEESRKAVAEKFARIAAGEIPSGGRGGARITDLERELRESIGKFARAHGWKAKDIPTDSRAALFAVITRMMAKAKSLPESAINAADRDAAVAAAYDTFVANANAVLAARSMPEITVPGV